MRGDGGEVVMKAIQREDCYQSTDAQKVMGGGHCHLWTYGASAVQADTPYCDCYRGVCITDGAGGIGHCDESPKNTVVVTKAVVPGTLSLTNQPSADVIASTAKDLDLRTDQMGLNQRATDFPRPSRGGAKEEEDDTYNRRSLFQPLHQQQVMMYDDHLYQTSGPAYRCSMQLARGIGQHAPPVRVAECLEYSKDGSVVTERPDSFGFTGKSMTAEKNCRLNDCSASD